MAMDQVSITVPYSAAGVRLLNVVAAEMQSELAKWKNNPASAAVAAAPAAVAAEAPAEKKPRGRPKKDAAAAAETSAAGDELDLDGGTSGDDLLGDGGDVGDELGLDEPAPAPKAKEMSLEGDLIPLFKRYIEKAPANKDKLGKLFEKYGVKSAKALPKDKYAEIHALLTKALG